jgi:hypothetical protein
MVKTLTFRLDVPNNRTLHLILPPDVPVGFSEIVLVIAPAEAASPAAALAGRWQAYFPPQFDLEQTLHEIRHEWETEWSGHE